MFLFDNCIIIIIIILFSDSMITEFFSDIIFFVGCKE